MKRAVCIISGGMDSALSAKIAQQDGYELIGVHFNYGQRTEQKELGCYQKIVDSLEIKESYEIPLDFFKQIGATALIDKDLDIPTGGIEEGVPITYVPFRNGIFISIATAIAEKYGAEALYIGVVEEDSSGYPDCTEGYITSMQSAINLGTKDETRLQIKMPLIAMKKGEIVKKSLELKVPLEDTWSCYKNEDLACGLCDSCRLRLKGFADAQTIDPIAYEPTIEQG
ncbi:MAG: 7-cyano-7-deazaguanine synthase QueC [Sulfurovaceae bacterium]|nr:7-cyano-7-deazaguanine synthase QueC [Sulfurovaceae bacterium]